MATLVGEELFGYLFHLEREVKKRVSDSNLDSFEGFMHDQMLELLIAEREFLAHISGGNLNAAQLSISGNGLPSIESLRADLESICGLDGELGEIAKVVGERYKLGVNGGNNEGEMYKKVDEEVWKEELKEMEKKGLTSKVGIEIGEEDDKFMLRVRQGFYVDGFDRYSQEFPQKHAYSKDLIFQIYIQFLLTDFIANSNCLID